MTIRVLAVASLAAVLLPVRSSTPPVAVSSSVDGSGLRRAAEDSRVQAAPGSSGTGRLAWADVDGDGRLDALVLPSASGPRLLRGLGGGRFEDITPTSGLAQLSVAELARWVDADGDGRLDLYLGGVQSRLLLGHGDGTFEDVTALVGIHHHDDRFAEWIDTDGDGRPELHVLAAEGRLLYARGRDGAFIRTVLELPVTADAGAPSGASATLADAAAGSAADARPDGARSAGPSAVPGARRPGAGDPQAALGGGVASSQHVGNFQVGPPGNCLDRIEDVATGGCVQASSLPTYGALYPLGDELFIDSATGNVGVGTIAPGHALEVAGKLVSGTSNMSTGANGAVGGGANNNVSGNQGTVAGGDTNLASGQYATVGGGFSNRAVSDRATVAGGIDNAAGYSAIVGGGQSNDAGVNFAAVLGGRDNGADASFASVGGGANNHATGNFAFVGGGGDDVDPLKGNTASGLASSVAGGRKNSAGGDYAGIAGGFSNDATGNYAFVGGGQGHFATGSASVIGGGDSNSAGGGAALVAGGESNGAAADYSAIGGGFANSVGSVADGATIAGGEINSAGGDHAAVGGGLFNEANGSRATVAGGRLNIVDGSHGTIAGGESNTASAGHATVAGGNQNTASGVSSTVPGGFLNEAAGASSFAAGYRAKALHTGTFVWAQAVPSDFASTADGQFLIRASGGVGIGTNAPGAALDVVGTMRASDTIASTKASGAPLSVVSTDVVPNLNADMLDGLDASAFSVFGSQVDSSEIADGTIADADVSSTAAISGLKIQPYFGAQDLAVVGDTRKLIFAEGPFAPTASLFYDGAGVLGGENHVRIRNEVDGINLTTWELNGNVGVGLEDPEVRLHVAGGTDVSQTGGGYFQAGTSAGRNVAIDDNEIMARNNGAAAVLTLNAEGGDVVISPSGSGRVGIGTSAPIEDLHVSGDVVVGAGGSGDGSEEYLEFFATDNVRWLVGARNEPQGSFVVRGINPTPMLEITSTGHAKVQVLEITGGADIVESFDTGAETCEPGSVLVIDPEKAGRLRCSTEPYDKKVAGIASGAGGVRAGLHLGQEGLDGDTLVAMAGRVWVSCTAENGAIAPGDLLTTSALAGHAMRATDPERSFGSVVGKAMSALDGGTGLVLVLVNLQ